MTSIFLTRRERTQWWLVFGSGFALSIIMAMRSQIGGDQLMLLELGWKFVVNGEWLQYGMPTSAGGRSPGGLMALLMAIPLWIWRDYRSPALFTALLHACAFILLAYTLRSTLTRRGMWLLMLLVWLNPWRMYFSAHIWNANLMFIAAVLHLASAQRMAAHKEAWNSCAQALLIALAMQVHTSAAVLAVLSLLLWWKGMIKVHWGGIACGVILGIASYVPWLLTIHNDPSLTPGDKGFFLRGLIYVFPLVRGILYWIKMSSLFFTSRMEDLNFSSLANDSINTALVWFGLAVTYLAYLTILPSAWAHWRFVRKLWPSVRQPVACPSNPRAWLRIYIALSMLAAVFCFCISPTTIMFWQVFISIPTAALVVTMTGEGLLGTKLKTKTKLTIKAWSALVIMLLLLQCFGAPIYRCGGPEDKPGATPLLISLHMPSECVNK